MKVESRNHRLDHLARPKGWPGFSAYCTALLRGELEIPQNPGEPTESFNIQGNPLTRRESQVLVRIVRGLSNKEIALQLKTSYQTTRHQVSSLLIKMGAKDKSEIVGRYIQSNDGDQNLVTRESFMDVLEKVSRPVSRKESEVLSLARQGLNSSEIGFKLGKNKKTVDIQLDSARRKLGLGREPLSAPLDPVALPTKAYLPTATPATRSGYCRRCCIIRLSQSDRDGICLECSEDDGS